MRSKNFDELKAECPPEAQEFLDRFYPKRGTHIKRRRDVALQLAMLAHGCRILDPKKQPVCAYSRDRLDAKCREVIESEVRSSDRAIVILMTKLGDTSDGSAPGEQEAGALNPRPSDVEQTFAEDVIEMLPTVDSR